MTNATSRAQRASRAAPETEQAADSDCGGDGQSMACAGSSADRFSGPAAPDFRGASRIAGEAPLAGGRFYRRFMRLTAAQRRALNWAEDDAVLQIGGLDGRPVRRDVAERLVDLGLLVRSKTPDPIQNYWEYRPATKAHDQNSPSS